MKEDSKILLRFSHLLILLISYLLLGLTLMPALTGDQVVQGLVENMLKPENLMGSISL